MARTNKFTEQTDRGRKHLLDKLDSSTLIVAIININVCRHIKQYYSLAGMCIFEKK